jgi:hypothetical protein
MCSIPPLQTINEHRRPFFILISATLPVSQPYIVKNMAIKMICYLTTFHRSSLSRQLGGMVFSGVTKSFSVFRYQCRNSRTKKYPESA